MPSYSHIAFVLLLTDNGAAPGLLNHMLQRKTVIIHMAQVRIAENLNCPPARLDSSVLKAAMCWLQGPRLQIYTHSHTTTGET